MIKTEGLIYNLFNNLSPNNEPNSVILVAYPTRFVEIGYFCFEMNGEIIFSPLIFDAKTSNHERRKGYDGNKY